MNGSLCLDTTKTCVNFAVMDGGEVLFLVGDFKGKHTDTHKHKQF